LLVTAAVVFAAIAAMAATVAVVERSSAVNERNDAQYRQVLSAADELRNTNLSLSAQLNMAAYRMRPADPDVHTRLLATGNAPLAGLLTGHTGAVYLASFGPDGKVLASAGENHTVRLWDVHDRARPVPLGNP
jgi:WD40 repeat protein